MVQGRCSAVAATVLLCCLLLHFEVAQSASFTVGGRVFNYNPSIHNVVAVNRAGYKSCKAPKGAKVFKSGKDQIKLKKGQNFFICNYIGHCQAGMKIAVTAA
ncbi:hypothetical protein E1A91_A01G191500v1 [Gossypium mustelinum]|uniref:Phytocyanin domain-containing protein n=1 Tax=Gossypium mustelinum TaxID=34275 RepID=A0A5D3AHB6_GOSMU|nr:hypothetical protein E1A91_A01G191500v1 [Gossypium mustelinum]